jgi:hypothetical protein
MIIKIMKVKIKIKNKLEGNPNFFYWRDKMKRKITSIKGKKSKELGPY